MKTQSSFLKQLLWTRHPAAWATMLLLLSALASHGAVVTEPTEAALRSAIAGGGTVTFAVEGTITLTSTITLTNDVVLDATGHQVTISGAQNVGVFRVNPAVHFGAMNLVIANGRATNGGAIYNDGGTVTLAGDVLTGNLVTSGNTNDVCGGALFNAGTINATNCTFSTNSALGWDAPPWPSGMTPTNGAHARGGAIFSLGTLNLSGCSFLQNVARGGRGQPGQPGYYPYGPRDGGPGAGGGWAVGGAICSLGSLLMEQSLIAGNSATGGYGGTGGSGLSYPCVYPGNGGPGAGGGSAFGGLYLSEGSTIVNCTFAGNVGTGGPGGGAGSGGTSSCHGLTAHGINGSPGANGLALGGMYDSSAVCGITNCSFAFNQGGGIQIDGGAVNLVNTLLYFNEPGGNSIGQPIDLGHNISSDASCAFTNAGSLNNTDPRLAPLADNGGPTWTMALLWGSPAIDAGDTAVAPPTDQRGYMRPLGLAPDIGAFEYGLPISLQVSITPNGRVNIMVCAAPSQLCHLLASNDLVNWELFGINIAGPGGTAFFQDDTKGRPQRFYRAMLP